jgi:hypothetical protein
LAHFQLPWLLNLAAISVGFPMYDTVFVPSFTLSELVVPAM